MSASITDTQGIIAIVAGAMALASALGCVWLAHTLRRLRASQHVVLGEHNRDLIGHSAQLQEAFEGLRTYVEQSSQRLDERLGFVEQALRATITHRSLVRYDAYNELSGRQSMSIALLDDEQSGIVLTCIHHRDQVRVYAKQVHGGRGELEFSPEESEAVRLALHASSSDVTES